MRSYSDYFYSGTLTLQNKFGIKDPDELERVEAAITRVRMRGLTDPIDLTPDGLKALHHHIFQDVYEWAGDFRSVDMEQVEGDNLPNVRFASGALIERIEMPRFFDQLAYDMDVSKSFDGIDRKTFGYRAAVYMADLNFIHPFPEGNGRTQRLILEEIAKRAGHDFNHSRIDRETWIEASVDSYGQDKYDQRGDVVELGPHEKMTSVIANALEDRSRNKIQDRETQG